MISRIFYKENLFEIIIYGSYVLDDFRSNLAIRMIKFDQQGMQQQMSAEAPQGK